MNLQQIIEQKAREEYESALNQIIFEKGATFATTSPEVLKEILGPFAHWLRDNTLDDGAPKRIYKTEGKRYTTEELINKFIQETLKHPSHGDK